jgi:hypothetical protein
MIQFNNLNQEIPYQLLKEKYDEAVDEDKKVLRLFQFLLTTRR